MSLAQKWLARKQAEAGQPFQFGGGRRYAMPGTGRMPSGLTITPGPYPVLYGPDAMYQGDSIFKKIGKVLGKVALPIVKMIPGVGNVVSAGESVLKAALPSSTKRSKTAGPSGGSLVAAAGGGLLGGAMGGQVPMMLTGGPDLPGFNNPLTGQTVGAGSGPLPKGYRWNKSRYYIDHPAIPGSEMGQEIEPGTRLVKIRRRNPFNPRAASRAMSRLAALHHGMKALEKNLRRLAPPARHRAPARGAFGRKK